jgi:hypothetical protein
MGASNLSRHPSISIFLFNQSGGIPRTEKWGEWFNQSNASLMRKTYFLQLYAEELIYFII